MERLSIQSFLGNGHAYRLYGFERPANMPDGVEYRQATDILPNVDPAEYAALATYADYFRYALLSQCGGWWADMDVVCLRPFMATGYVFASEVTDSGSAIANNAVMRAPAGSPVMEFAVKVCASKEPGEVTWGELGPRLLDVAVRGFGLSAYVAAPETFCPLSYREWGRLLDEGSVPDSQAIHLWGEMWRQWSRDKDARYSGACPYERLKLRYAVV